MEKRARGRPRGGGSKLQRSETVTIRFDPKLRYLMEVAARKQRRTVSSFIEWSVEQTLSQVELTMADNETHDPVARAALWLWEPHEADRLAKLALYYPDLLTYDELVVWKLIEECEGLWNWPTPRTGLEKHIVAPERDKALNYPKLRAHWEDVKKVAAGEADTNILPKDVVGQRKR